MSKQYIRPLSFKEKVAASLRQEGYTVHMEKFHPLYLKKFNFSISTIIDIGVFKGTQPLYDSFPEAHILLVDPIDYAKETYERLSVERSTSFVQAVAGAHEGVCEFNIVEDFGAKSSVLNRTALTHEENIKKIFSPVKRLDDIVSSKGVTGPFGLKIDTEGYELEVIKGAYNTLTQTEFVIAEVSVRRRFENGYLFSDMITEMRTHGFELVDTLSCFALPRFIDCLFIKSDSQYIG